MKYVIMVYMMFSALAVYAEEVANVGIVQGIWFSQDSYVVGDTVRIYTAVHNNTGSDVEGYVEFYNGNSILGTKHFNSLHGRITEVWMDTLATVGEHQFIVKITELTKNQPGENAEAITPRIIQSAHKVIVQHAPPPKEENVSHEKENSNSEPSLVKEIIDILRGESQSETETLQEDTHSLSGENQVHENQSSIVQQPEYIEKLESSYSFVQKITQPLNEIQNVIVTRTQKEQTRLQEQSLARAEQVIETSPESKYTSTQSWLQILYTGFLWLIEKIFSSLILTVLITFGLIFLILKILFKIFGRRSAY